MSEISKLDQNLIIRKIDSETINIQITNNKCLCQSLANLIRI